MERGTERRRRKEQREAKESRAILREGRGEKVGKEGSSLASKWFEGRKPAERAEFWIGGRLGLRLEEGRGQWGVLRKEKRREEKTRVRGQVVVGLQKLSQRERLSLAPSNLNDRRGQGACLFTFLSRLSRFKNLLVL